MKIFLVVVVLLTVASCQKIIERNECINQLPRFRTAWKFVPNEIQTTFIREIVGILSGLRVYRNITREVLTKTLVDLGDDKVEIPLACSNAQKYIAEPLEQVQNCVSVCIDKADLTVTRLIAAIFKCRTDVECYVTEIQVVLRVLIPCIQKCV